LARLTEEQEARENAEARAKCNPGETAPKALTPGYSDVQMLGIAVLMLIYACG
jgi:hypothetical protein